MEEALSIFEVMNLTRGTGRLLMLLKFFDCDAVAYAQWITEHGLQFMELRGMTQTPRGYKVLWDTWKKAATREYETLVIIENTMMNPGGGTAYIARGNVRRRALGSRFSCRTRQDELA